MYELLSRLLIMPLIPPNVIPYDIRIRINNTIAYFIYKYKIPNFNEVAMEHPLLNNNQMWSSVEIDYLGQMYQRYYNALRHSRDQVAVSTADFLQSYFRGVPFGRINESVRFERDGQVSNHLISTIIPYLNNGENYAYLQDRTFADIKNQLYNVNEGFLIPTQYGDNNVPNMDVFTARLQCTSYLLSALQDKPVSYPSANIRDDLINIIRRQAVGCMSAVYSKYYNIASKMPLNLACDPIVRNGCSLQYKRTKEVEIKSVIPMLVYIDPMAEIDLLESPALATNLGNIAAASVFLYIYRLLYQQRNVFCDQLAINVTIDKGRIISDAERLTGAMLNLGGFSIKDKLLLPQVDRVSIDEILNDLNPSNNVSIIDNHILASTYAAGFLREIDSYNPYFETVYTSHYAISCKPLCHFVC